MLTEVTVTFVDYESPGPDEEYEDRLTRIIESALDVTVVSVTAEEA